MTLCKTCGRRPSERHAAPGQFYQHPPRGCPDPVHDLADRVLEFKARAERADFYASLVEEMRAAGAMDPRDAEALRMFREDRLDCGHPISCEVFPTAVELETYCGWCQDLERMKELQETIAVLSGGLTVLASTCESCRPAARVILKSAGIEGR